MDFQYRPIASALAKKLKTLVKVKLGDDSEAETLAKFDADGHELSLSYPAVRKSKS